MKNPLHGRIQSRPIRPPPHSIPVSYPSPWGKTYILPGSCTYHIENGGDTTVKSTLVGYVRKSNGKGALKLSISKDAFEEAEKYLSQDGSEYVGLVINIARVQEILEGTRDVTSICQIAAGT